MTPTEMARLRLREAAKDLRARNRAELVLWVVMSRWLKVWALGAGLEARRGRVGKKRRRWASQLRSTGGGIRSTLLRTRMRRLPPPRAAMTARSTSRERVPSGSRASKT